jgi:hypothetical protein
MVHPPRPFEDSAQASQTSDAMRPVTPSRR